MTINNKGQVTVEYILIAMVMLAVFSGIKSNVFQKSEVVGDFINAPWAKVAGMIESGNWGGSQANYSGPNAEQYRKTAAQDHPGLVDHHLSLEGSAE